LAVRREIAIEELMFGFVTAAALKMTTSPPEFGMPAPLAGVQLPGAFQSEPVLFQV
jgi:hypothetical protein